MFARVKLRFRSLNRSEYAEESGQRVENPDALAQAAQVLGAPGNVPKSGGMSPGYVKSYDEGPPPH